MFLLSVVYRVVPCRVVCVVSCRVIFFGGSQVEPQSLAAQCATVVVEHEVPYHDLNLPDEVVEAIEKVPENRRCGALALVFLYIYVCPVCRIRVVSCRWSCRVVSLVVSLVVSCRVVSTER
jgi:hypothetical protein